MPVGERVKPSRLQELEAEILASVTAMVDDIAVLDRLIEEMHLLLEQLMYGTRKAIGVAWRVHSTRGGLHPTAYREGISKRAVVKPRQGRPAKRFWVTELNPPVRLARFALGDPSSEEWLVVAQKDVLRALERLLRLRARAMRCLTGQRIQVGAWAQQVRPGQSGEPVHPAFETKKMVKKIDANHFVRAHERGSDLGRNRQAGVDAVRDQDEADQGQRPR